MRSDREEAKAHETVTVRGIDVAYRFDGPRDAPVLMLANSILSDMSMWNANVGAFSERYRVLRYDMRGNGQSGVTSGAYTIESLADDAVALLDALGIERVHFVGLSLGGMVGQQLGARYPRRVFSLTLAATASEQAVPAAWDERMTIARERGVAAVVEGTIARWFTTPFVANSPHVIARIRTMIKATSVDGFVGCASAVRDLSQTGMLTKIKTPTLVVAGREDQAAPEKQARAIHSHIVGSEIVVLENAAHLCNIEQAELFNRSVGDFIDRISTVGPAG